MAMTHPLRRQATALRTSSKGYDDLARGAPTPKARHDYAAAASNMRDAAHLLDRAQELIDGARP